MKIKKESIKTRTESLLKEFLEENGYGIYNDAFISTRYTIRKPKSSEKQNTYYLEDMVSSGYSDLGGEEKFFDFINYAFNKNKGDIALNQLIKKTPRSNSYEYEGFVKKIIEVLKPHNKELFEYVSRSKFLEGSFNLIPNVSKQLSKEQLVNVIEQTFTTKTFTNIETQKKLYTFVKNEIEDSEELLKHFNKIKILKETENVLDKVSTPGAVLIQFNLEKLAGANIGNHLSVNQVFSHVESAIKTMADMNGSELGLIDLTIKKEKFDLSYKFIILCEQDKIELNKVVFQNLINSVVDLKDYKEHLQFKEDIGSFYKEWKTEHQFKELNRDLGRTNTSERKLKI